MDKKKNIYIDMDGTLAEWKEAADLSDLMKKGYFLSLKPTVLAKYANDLAINTRVNTYILSAYIPGSYAYGEKNEWVDKYVPNINSEHRFFVHDGVCKADFIIEALNRPLTQDDILIDDHSPNLISWQNAGGKAIKWLNGVNGFSGVFNGARISDIRILNAELFS